MANKFVPCPKCKGSGSLVRADFLEGNQTVVCHICIGSGHVPERLALEMTLDREHVVDLNYGRDR